MSGPESRRFIGGALVATLVFLYGVPLYAEQVPAGLPDVVGLVLHTLLCLPYVFRRDRTIAATALTAALAALQVVLGIGVLIGDVMLYFCIFSLARHNRWRVTVPALVVVGALVVGVCLPELRAGYLRIGSVASLLVLLVLVATWGSYLALLKTRADDSARAAADAERQRITREMHDVISHSLSSMVVMSEAALTVADRDPEKSRAAMTRVRDTGRSALRDMRSLLGVLRSPEEQAQVPQPGLDDVEELIDDTRAEGLSIDVHIAELPELPTGIQLTSYRIIQEALTNIRRHGVGVERIVVNMDVVRGELKIQVSNDGTDAAVPSGSGHGITGMAERARAHGGTLRASPLPGGGFEVVARIPIEEGT